MKIKPLDDVLSKYYDKLKGKKITIYAVEWTNAVKMKRTNYYLEKEGLRGYNKISGTILNWYLEENKIILFVSIGKQIVEVNLPS